MDILEAVCRRRAVSDCTDRTPSDSVIRSLIETADWEPSGVNLQPWRFVVVDGPIVLAACSTEATAETLGQADVHLELAQMREMLNSPKFNNFYNAPILVVICATTPEDMALKDCCLAAQTLMLAAHAEGLGSCWIGFPEAWLNTSAARARLGIPAEFQPVAPIIVDHLKASIPATERRAPDIRHVLAGRS